MKYYLIKAEDDGLTTRDKDLETTNYDSLVTLKEDYVELTEEGIKTLITLTTTTGPNELNERLWKVLENEEH